MENNAVNTAISKYINERYAVNSFQGAQNLKKKIKEIANNNVSKKKRKIENTIDLIARREKTEPHNVALKLLKKDKDLLKRFLSHRGVKAHNTFVGQAIQANAQRDNDIKAISEQLDVPFEDAELILEDAEAQLLDDNSADADEFLGGFAGVVKKVAQQGLDKLAKAKTGKTTQEIKTEAKKQGGGLGAWLNTIIGGVKETEKKKEIKKMLPFIIVGVVVLIVTTVLITKAVHKK